jgi:hypothetical protein
MRVLSPFVSKNSRTVEFLNIIADKSTSPEKYGESFRCLGEELGHVITNTKNIKNKNILLCCTNEDADWLANGILDTISIYNSVSLSVMWNHRIRTAGDESLDAAPVIKTYSEPIYDCDLLIVCKSIIFTSCVVRSNIQYLFEETKPKRTLIVSPVIFKGADARLKNEFPSNMSKEFEFIYFAQDDEAKAGEVVPGIGGIIYDRIGLGGVKNKNSYIPNIVKRRRLANK